MFLLSKNWPEVPFRFCAAQKKYSNSLSSLLLVSTCVCVVLGIKSRALHMLSEGSTTELPSPSVLIPALLGMVEINPQTNLNLPRSSLKTPVA
jgi:hypothetical protein